MRRALYFWWILLAAANFLSLGFVLKAVARETPSYIEVADVEILAEAGATNVAINVVRSGEFRQSCSIGYRTVDGTAKAGTDYVAMSDRLILAAGRSFVSINVPLIPMNSPVAKKEFFVVLEEPSANGFIVRGEVTVRIEGQTATPRLMIRPLHPANGSRAVVLAWPISVRNCVVEMCADPASGEWHPISEPVSVVGDEACVEIAKDQAKAFFRLRVP